MTAATGPPYAAPNDPPTTAHFMRGLPTMSDFSALLDRVAAHQIDERVRSRAAQMPSPRRPRGRHALADRLHALANRLDG